MTVHPPRKEPIKRRACGTTYGFNMHLRAFEEPCNPCKEAKSAATIEYNARTGYARARGRSYALLAKEYPEEYADLFDVELQNVKREAAPDLPHRMARDRARSRTNIALSEIHAERFAAIFEEHWAKVRAEGYDDYRS